MAKTKQTLKRETIKIPAKEKIDKIISKVSVDDLARTSAGPPRLMTEQEKLKAEEDQRRLEQMVIKQRALVSGIKVMGYDLIHRTFKSVHSLSDKELFTVVSDAAGGNISKFAKNVSDILKSLNEEGTKQTLEITRKRIETLGDDELEKEIIAVQTRLQQTGVKVD